MPLPNRVRPDGTLFADPARGTFYGNRGGRFHDPAAHEVPARIQATRQWLCCVLSFKGRKRKVWGRGYTELFFCDEVTALAAGHRPCMECRRPDALAYRAALVSGLGLPETPLFPEIDRILDADRLDGRTKRTHRLPAEPLPDGAMLLSDDGRDFLALRGASALLWSPGGYVARRARPTGTVTVLTPPATLAASARLSPAMARDRWSFQRNLTLSRQELSPGRERCRSIIVPTGAEKCVRSSCGLWAFRSRSSSCCGSS